MVKHIRPKKLNKNNKNKDKKNDSGRDQDLHDKVVYNRRVFVVILLMLGGFLALLHRIFYLQVVKNKFYATKSEKNRVRLQVIPPVRGNIYDRNGEALSENILGYDLVVNRSQSKDLEKQLQALPDYIKFDEKNREDFEEEKKKHSFYRNITVRSDLSEDEINRFVVDLFKFPGFDIQPSYKRRYPHGLYTAHVVGYINNINKKDLESLDPKQYAGTTKTGRTGIEKHYENDLHGQAGYQQVETDSSGKVIRVVEKVEPIPGKNINLGLDLQLQKIIFEELSGFEGSAVAIEPSSGEILAFVSNPSFDANLFVNGISHKDYDKLRNAPEKNLFNRALNGRYPPASTIKPLMVLTGLHHHIVSADSQTYCSGSYQIPDYSNTKKFYCWKRSGHGDTNANKSIVQSCDVYYYTIGRELGVDRIENYLSQFSLGQKTGVDLPNESAGILPSKAWKKEATNKDWFVGDTVNISIGQGYMLTTPLQMAHFTALLANKGSGFMPHFVTAMRSVHNQNITTKAVKATKVEQNHPLAWDIVQQSLYDTVNSSQGTARKIKSLCAYTLAGKTGTAQVASLKEGKRVDKDKVKDHLRDNSTFIGYAPYENPQIALSVMIENGGDGSAVAAPIAAKIIDRYLRLVNDNSRVAETIVNHGSKNNQEA